MCSPGQLRDLRLDLQKPHKSQWQGFLAEKMRLFHTRQKAGMGQSCLLTSTCVLSHTCASPLTKQNLPKRNEYSQLTLLAETRMNSVKAQLQRVTWWL